MILFIEHDTDSIGGYFSASAEKPDPARLRRTVDEIRVVEDFPEEVWSFVLAGGLPVDIDHSNDSTWVEWWDDAVPVWMRHTT